MRLDVAILGVALSATTPLLAAEPTLAFSAAWAAAADKGADTGLYMTVENGGAEDAIIRVRCEAAHFTELRTVDHGEGFPSARSIRAIPLVAQGTTILQSKGFNVRLLQLTGALVPGDRFDCAIRLRSGGQHTLSVAVQPADKQE